MALTKRLTKGSPLTAAEMDNNLDFLQASIAAGTSGTSGTSATSGTSGGTGSSGIAGSNGTSGSSGTAGLSGDKFSTTSTNNRTITNTGSLGFTIGTGLQWTVGQQMLIAFDASNTMTGTVTSYNSGTGALVVTITASTGSGNYSDWLINILGAPGQSGTNGTSGANGTSGVNGTNGSGGIDGVNGSSGTSGVSGTNGSAGTSGVSGTNGVSTDISALNTYTGSNDLLRNRILQTTASLNTFTGSVRGELNGLEAYTASLKNSNIISGAAQITALGFGGGGIFSQTGSFWATTNNVQITGALDVNGPITASLPQGFMLVGGVGNKTTLVSTASLTAGALTLNGFTLGGVVTFNVPSSTVNSNLTFINNLLSVSGNISSSGTFTASLASGYAWVGGIGNRATLVATSSFGGGTATTDGIFRTTGSAVATTNNVQITGSLDINGPMSASLRQGFAWVGGSTNKNTLQVPTSSFGTSLTIGDTIPNIPISGVTQITFAGGTVSNQGNGLVTVTIAGGGGGTSGTSGVSGLNGSNGTSGLNGSGGSSGTSGTSGTSGFTGSDGTSGTSGVNGISIVGPSGTNGVNGTSGLNGLNGTSGTSGISGTSGVNGSDGIPGTSGTSGISGTSGFNGFNGSGGSSGTSGLSGTSGISGFTVSGSTNNGIVTYDTSFQEGLIESDLTFDASSKVLTVSGSIDLYTAIQIRRQLSWPPAVQPAGTLMVSASGAGGALMYYNGASWIPLAAGL